MTLANVSKAGRFAIGGVIDVARLGFGAMRITGKGVWGEPQDRPEVLRTLQRTKNLGIDFIDTADAYGPDISEELIREALHPYGATLIATKGGMTRTGPNKWTALGRPEYLIQQAQKSRRRLGVYQIGLWQLHRIDPKTPRVEQFAAVKSLIDDGTIKLAGLSNVSVDDIKAAMDVFPVATVQNRYNLVDRASADVLDFCGQHGIGFIPWRPLATEGLDGPGSVLNTIAGKHQATPSQVALAWLLKRSPVMLPIPGTGSVAHLDENAAAVDIELTADEFAALDREGESRADAG